MSASIIRLQQIPSFRRASAVTEAFLNRNATPYYRRSETAESVPARAVEVLIRVQSQTIPASHLERPPPIS
jgi:hypothetical protein